MGYHDCGYKTLFSYPTMVEELLRGFVRERWVDDLDFTTLEKRSSSYVSDDLREREDDVIWRVKWKGAHEWMYVYVLLEFQSTNDRFMGLRLLNYLTLLYQDLIKNGEVTDKLLPPVLPITLYRGEEKWTASLNFKDLVRKPPPGLGRYIPSFKYFLLEEVRLDDKELEQIQNLASDIFRIEKSPSLKACIPPILSFLKWTSKAGASQDSLKRAFFLWFNKAQKPAKILLENDDLDIYSEEVETMLSERIEKWSYELRAAGEAKGRIEGEAKGRVEGEAKGRVEGEAKGRVEGEAKAKVEIFTKLYEKKFGSLSQEIIDCLKSADTSTVESLIESLIFAANPEDVLKSLN